MLPYAAREEADGLNWGKLHRLPTDGQEESQEKEKKISFLKRMKWTRVQQEGIQERIKEVQGATWIELFILFGMHSKKDESQSKHLEICEKLSKVKNRSKEQSKELQEARNALTHTSGKLAKELARFKKEFNFVVKTCCNEESAAMFLRARQRCRRLTCFVRTKFSKLYKTTQELLPAI